MSIFFVDVEADGPVPGLYSMTELGVIRFDYGNLENAPTFYAKLRPLPGASYNQSALDVTHSTREGTLQYPPYEEGMVAFAKWVAEHNRGSRPLFMSDNNGFDFAYVNYYFHLVKVENPFGWSSRNLADLYKGLTKDVRANFRHLRRTRHTHHPVDDARGNAEAYETMITRYGLAKPST